MPRGDQTGPTGTGPRTGRAMGYCVGNDAPGYMYGPGRGMGRGMKPGMGRGMGPGMGRGMGPGMGRGMGPGMAWRNARGYGGGFGNRFVHPDQPYEDLAPTREEELQQLKYEAERLQRTLDEVNKRIKDLEE